MASREKSKSGKDEDSHKDSEGDANCFDAEIGAVLFNNSPNAAFTINANGDCTAQNLSAQKMLNASFGQIQNTAKILPEIDLNRVRSCILSGESYNVFIRRENRSYRLDILGLPKLEIAGVYGIEITDLAKIEMDLLRSQSVLRKVLDTDPNMIFVKDKLGRFVLVNQAVADVYGTTVDNLIGKKDSDFNPKAEEISHFVNDDLEVIESQKEKKILEESVSDFAGNSRYFSTVKRPLTLAPNEESYVLGVSTDISALKKLQEQLGQASKMEALGQLAGGIAHDFNNLLTAVLGYADILKITHGADDQIIKPITMIQAAANQAKVLTEQLLGFARKGIQQDTVVDLHALIKETVSLMGRTIDSSIQIKTELLPLRPYVRGDPVQLQRVIMNLIINARDAILCSSDSGRQRIEIKTRNITKSDSSNSRMLELSISDNGCGMNPLVQSKMFEPFFTTKGIGKGTGLGLSTAYGVIHNHGGDIRVESQEGLGTQFYIILPYETDQAGIEEKTVKNISSGIGAGPVLLVDDHPDVLAVTSSMLETLGVEVRALSSGIDAIEALKKDPQFFKAAILDMVMPDLNGIETAEVLRKIQASLPVLIISGYTQNESIREITDNGYQFLKKPFELDALREALSGAMHGVVK